MTSEVIECPNSPDPMNVGPALHRIDYTNRKTVVVIDKDHFCLCKRLLIEGAADEDFASALAIPMDKVRIFKYKMQLFEDRLRGRRRAARLNLRRMKRKKRRLPSDKVGELEKELSSEERYKCARDLILQNYTTREISKVLKISIRSVTRFRKRLREAKKEMVKTGELEMDEAEDEWEFKYLSPELKGQKIADLLEQGLAAVEIGKMLKINERSVRRWRFRIEQMKNDPEKYAKGSENLPPSYRLQPKSHFPHRRYIKCVDRATVENIRKLLESGATNKEICVRLGIPMSIVMKVVQRIWTNTIEGIIDDTPDKIREVEKRKRVDKEELDNSEDEIKIKRKKKKKKVKREGGNSQKGMIDDDDEDWDPHGLYKDENDYWNDDFEKYEGVKKKVDLSGAEIIDGEEKKDVEEIHVTCDPLCASPVPSGSLSPPQSPKLHDTRKKVSGNSTKKGLTDFDALVAHKLKENNVRTIDIALMMDISERTVTRLFNKARTLDTKKQNQEVDKIVDKFIEDQDQYRGTTKPRNKNKSKNSRVMTRRAVRSEKKEDVQDDNSKRQTGLRLLAMNVKVTDIMKMLNVCERTVTRWKLKLREEKDDEGGHPIFNDLLEVKDEPDEEDFDI